MNGLGAIFGRYISFSCPSHHDIEIHEDQISTVPSQQTVIKLHFEIEIKGDSPIGVQLTKAIIFLKINFN